jgi:two-component system sensor histidine kinase DesK
MRQYFVLLFEPLPHQTNIIFPTIIPEIELENEVRRNIFLCFKESLNNVIKHAHSNNVELRVNIISNTLTIEIKDNGSGFLMPPGGFKTGNGLKNIISRMAAINGQSHIFNDGGTIVRLGLVLPPYPNG